MNTVAYPEMKELVQGIEKIFPSAVCSGIVGDRRHTTGYHLGRRFVRPDDYSVVRPDDRGQGPDDGAAGFDITMNRRDMILATRRLWGAYANRNDPRRKYLNAFNGWDGSGDAIRADFYARRTKRATSDHKWHLHGEKRRRYIRDRTANDGILSILRGESAATWLGRRGVMSGSATKPAALKPPRYPGRVLQRNDRARAPDAAVRQWQQRMRDRGWTSIGKADGFPGRRFETVVRAWQKTIRFPITGRVDERTWPTPWTRPMGH